MIEKQEVTTSDVTLIDIVAVFIKYRKFIAGGFILSIIIALLIFVLFPDLGNKISPVKSPYYKGTVEIVLDPVFISELTELDIDIQQIIGNTVRNKKVSIDIINEIIKKNESNDLFMPFNISDSDQLENFVYNLFQISNGDSELNKLNYYYNREINTVDIHLNGESEKFVEAYLSSLSNKISSSVNEAILHKAYVLNSQIEAAYKNAISSLEGTILSILDESPEDLDKENYSNIFETIFENIVLTLDREHSSKIAFILEQSLRKQKLNQFISGEYWPPIDENEIIKTVRAEGLYKKTPIQIIAAVKMIFIVTAIAVIIAFLMNYINSIKNNEEEMKKLKKALQ